MHADDRKGALLLQPRTRGDIAQHERAPVVREPTRRPVERDLRNPVASRQDRIADDAAASPTDRLDDGAAPRGERHVPDRPARDPVPTLHD